MSCVTNSDLDRPCCRTAWGVGGGLQVSPVAENLFPPGSTSQPASLPPSLPCFLPSFLSLTKQSAMVFLTSSTPWHTERSFATYRPTKAGCSGLQLPGCPEC